MEEEVIGVEAKLEKRMVSIEKTQVSNLKQELVDIKLGKYRGDS